jgi:hypothetical protein
MAAAPDFSNEVNNRLRTASKDNVRVTKIEETPTARLSLPPLKWLEMRGISARGIRYHM